MLNPFCRSSKIRAEDLKILCSYVNSKVEVGPCRRMASTCASCPVTVGQAHKVVFFRCSSWVVPFCGAAFFLFIFFPLSHMASGNALGNPSVYFGFDKGDRAPSRW